MRRTTGKWLAFAAVAAGWAGVLIWMEMQKFLSFRESWDLGIYVQAMWSTAHGRPFYTSVFGAPGNFLGHHFAPVLAVLAPLYRLWPDGRLLLIAQVVALAAAAIPLFVFARTRLGFGAAMVVVLAYYLYPPLHSVALSDFHEINLVIPLLMAAGVALVDKRFKLTLCWLALAMLTKEEVAFVAIGFGLYIWLVHHHPRLGATVAIASTAWAVLLFRIILPAFNNGLGFQFFDRYATLGASPGQMLETLVLRPMAVARLASSPDKLLFIFQLLAPLAGIPLLGTPIVLLALPTLAYLLLSDYGFMTSISGYYQAPMIPFLFLGLVVGLERMRRWRPRFAWGAVAAVAGATLITMRLWSAFPGGQNYDAELYRVTEAHRVAGATLMGIPRDASLATERGYEGWLANRLRMTSLTRPGGPEILPDTTTEYLVVDALAPSALEPPRYPWIVDPSGDGPLRVPRYDLLEQTEQGVAIYKWAGPEQDVALERYDVPFEQGLALIGAGTPRDGPVWGQVITATQGSTVPMWMAWRSTEPFENKIAFSLHLVDAGNRTVAQIDAELLRGHFPSTLWHRYESHVAFADEFPLALPRDLPPGRYRLLAGAYEVQDVAALSRPDGSQWFELASVDVQPAQE